MAQYTGNKPRLISDQESRQQENHGDPARDRTMQAATSAAATGLNLSANDDKMSESDDNTLTDENKFQTAQK